MKQKRGYWTNTIEIAFKRGEFSLTAKRQASKWNQCSVGEKNLFTGGAQDEPDDRFLDNLGVAFSNAVDDDNMLLAGIIHRTIRFYNPRKPQTAYVAFMRSGLSNLHEMGYDFNDGYVNQAIAIAQAYEEDSTTESAEASS